MGPAVSADRYPDRHGIKPFPADLGEVRSLSKRLSQHYTSSGDLPPCADMSELRFELPSTEPVVHGDAAFGRSPKTRVTPEASFEYSSGYIQLMATQRV